MQQMPLCLSPWCRSLLRSHLSGSGSQARIISSLIGLNVIVRVDPGPRNLDPYGRTLKYLYTEDGESIDEALVREGLAVAWTRDGQHRDHLMELEQEAKQNGTGCLW